ncbi:MAG: hypothetical protein GY798_04640 [Hyphomicrobiales bacterium]|nr:hypothetical protein [Hyphomicrobiales bacterium]
MSRELLFVYAATGDRFLREGALSAASCRRHMPGCRTMLLTPDATAPDGFDEVIQFGEEIQDPFELKIAGMAAVEADRFVFLDTDTYLLADISEIDSVLDQFDLAAAQAPVRLQSNLWPETEPYLRDAPVCFPELNTGVIAFRRSPAVVEMLENWLALHRRHAQSTPPPRTQDQASFRSVVYASDLRLATLPPEYNCRFPYPTSVCGEVKLLHGHADQEDFERIGRGINRNRRLRLITRERFLADSLVMKAPAK